MIEYCVDHDSFETTAGLYDVFLLAYMYILFYMYGTAGPHDMITIIASCESGQLMLTCFSDYAFKSQKLKPHY